MTFSSSAFGQLRYITESVNGVTPNTGNGVNLRSTGPTLKAAVKTTSSQEVSSTRMSSGLTRTDMDLDGGFNFELSGKEYDPFLEALMDGVFNHFGTAGLGAPFSMATTSNTITAGAATTGASIFTSLPQGSWIKVVAPGAATQAVKDYFADKWFKVSTSVAPTALAVTLDASTPITGVGLMASTAGYAISASRVQNAAGLNRSFTLEHNLSDIVQFLPFRGMRTNTMELSFDVGNIITGSFGFIGQGHDGMVGVSTLPGSPVASQSLEVMNSVSDMGAIYENGASILSGSTSFIKSVKLSVSNGMRGQKALGVYGNAGVGLGELEVSGTMEVYVENATYYNKWLTGAVTNLALGVADAAGNGYLVELDKVQFKDGGLNLGGRNDDVMLSLPFQASYNAALGRGIRITRAVAA